MTANSMVMGDFDGGRRGDRGRAATHASPQALKRSYGPESAPADLLAFVASRPQLDAARELGLSKGTVHNLLRGYWPADPRFILRAWAAYEGRRSVPASRWFLRRVYPGGVVLHASRRYGAAELAWRVGQSVALARADDGALLAQTLELPAERMVLAEVAQ